jgi:hypothetical protein
VTLPHSLKLVLTSWLEFQVTLSGLCVQMSGLSSWTVSQKRLAVHDFERNNDVLVFSFTVDRQFVSSTLNLLANLRALELTAYPVSSCHILYGDLYSYSLRSILR